MTSFVLVYDRGAGQILDQADFSSIPDAVRHRIAMETQYAQNPDIEVVLLGAKTIDSLHTTHRRYFRSTAQLAREFAAG